MESLSPVIAIFFMEDFKEVTVSGAVSKPYYWFSYIDDMFVIGPMVQKDRRISWNT
jgi:hypothetical protein